MPPKKRDGITPPPKPRGDADAMLADVPVKLEQEYRIAAEYHNPMEPHATTVIWQGDGKIIVHDKIQGVQNDQSYIAKRVRPAKRATCGWSRPSSAARSAPVCGRNTSCSWR